MQLPSEEAWSHSLIAILFRIPSTAKVFAELSAMGRFLVVAGVFFIVAGLLVVALNKLGLPLGRLPGDLSWRGKNVSVFAPLGTSLLLSVLLSLAFLLFNFLRR